MEERLQKLIAAAGLASRRHAEEMIAAGEVTVNGKLVTVAKVYEVKVKGVPPEEAIERLRRGIRLDDGVHTAPAEVTHAGETGTNAWFQVILHEGRNQQIRRMFDAIGHSVLKLRRTRIGDLQDERLPVGAYRLLSPAEVARLKPRAEKKRPAPAGTKAATKGASKTASKTGAKGAAKSRGAGTGRRRS
jgi:23S rRNA pseudouridine2605 synthase